MREFSTELKKEEVMIDGELYVIRELTADGRSVYLKAVGKTMDVRLISTGEKDAKNREVMRREIKVLDMDGAQKELLSSTMFRVDSEGKATPVTKPQVGGWGSKLVEELVKISSDLNGLERTEEEHAEEAEKN